MFLERKELKTVSTADIIAIITNRDDSTVDAIILESIDIMSSYLHQYYDIEAIFEKEGAERSLTIVKHLKSLVIHGIYKIRSKVMNELVKEDYDEAMTWLEKVSEGKIKPNLPVRTVDTDGDGISETPVSFMKLGSRKNYENRI